MKAIKTVKRSTLVGAVALAFLLSSGAASAQEAPAPLVSETYPSALGFSFGTDMSPASIFNIQYQRWMGKFGVSANLGGMRGLSGDGSWGADCIVDLQYAFSSGNFIPSGNIFGALYGIIQTGYVAANNVTSYDDAGNPASYAISQYVPAGVGIGIEFTFFKHFSLPLEVGFEYHALSPTNYFGPFFNTAIRYRY